MNDKLKKDFLDLKNEFVPTDSYNYKFNETLDNIFNDTKNRKVKFHYCKASIAIALISIITITSVAFGENVVAIGKNVISFFRETPTTNIKLKDKIESITSSVNISDEHDGIKFTLEDMAIDDNFLLCFYTIKAESENLLSETLDERFTYFSGITYEIDGKSIRPDYGYYAEKDSYTKSNREIKLMEKINLSNFSIKNSGDINISFYNNNCTNTWLINTTYDKTSSKKYTKTIDLNKDVSFGESHYAPMTIKKICFSPLGNLITIETDKNTETSATTADNFIMMDDKNNYLEKLNTFSVDNNGKSTISIEFTAPDADISSLKIIPAYYTYNQSGPTKTDLYDLDNMPSTIDLGETKIVVNDVSFENNEIKLRYQYDGFNLSRTLLDSCIYDENGNELATPVDHGYINHTIDRISNNFIETYGFYTKANFLKAKKISFFMHNLDTEIKYDDAIELNLNSK